MNANEEGYHPVQLETFVVRLWREPSSGAWRGEIVHVADRAAEHFASFEQAEAFMRRYVAGGTEAAETMEG